MQVTGWARAGGCCLWRSEGGGIGSGRRLPALRSQRQSQLLPQGALGGLALQSCPELGRGARASSSCMATEGGLPPRAGCDLVLVALFTASPGEGLSGNSAPPQEGRARAAGLEVVTGAGSAPSAAQASYCSHPSRRTLCAAGSSSKILKGLFAWKNF